MSVVKLHKARAGCKRTAQSALSGSSDQMNIKIKMKFFKVFAAITLLVGSLTATFANPVVLSPAGNVSISSDQLIDSQSPPPQSVSAATLYGTLAEILGAISAAGILDGRRTPGVISDEELNSPVKQFDTKDGVCYGELGCFYNAFPFPHVNRLPADPQTIGVKFRLAETDSESLTGIKYKTLPVDPSSGSATWPDFKPGDRVVFLIHGFNENYLSPHWANLTKAILKNVPDKVIVVDWSRGAAYPYYEQSVANMQVPARLMSTLIENLRGFRKISPKNVHLVGASLGAHLAGHAGRYSYEKYAYKLGRITGLDPAWPMFEQYPGSHLNKEDASFVDVIHTSAGNSILMGEMGFQRPLGHVDFYPNRGVVPQPHCGTQPIFAPVDCSQRAALKYFEVSVVGAGSKCRFTSISCPSWADYSAHRCDTDEPAMKSRMGYYAAQEAGRGVQYLDTLPKWPHCMPESGHTAAAPQGQASVDEGPVVVGAADSLAAIAAAAAAGQSAGGQHQVAITTQ